jgi:hypothetical protein
VTRLACMAESGRRSPHSGDALILLKGETYPEMRKKRGGGGGGGGRERETVRVFVCVREREFVHV